MGNVSVSQSWVDDISRERQEMLRKLERQTDEIARLRAALKPFAEAARRIPGMDDEGAALVSVASLRAALKAMEGT